MRNASGVIALSLGAERRPLAEILAFEPERPELADLLRGELATLPGMDTRGDGLCLAGAESVTLALAFCEVIRQRANCSADLGTGVDDEEEFHISTPWLGTSGTSPLLVTGTYPPEKDGVGGGFIGSGIQRIGTIFPPCVMNFFVTRPIRQ